MQLNEKEWDAFFIGDEKGLFKITASLSGIDKNKLKLSEDAENSKIPYITRSNIDNGINLFIPLEQQKKYKLNNSNVITIGLDTQTVFYQPHLFFTGQNIQVLQHEQMSLEKALFLMPLLKTQMQKFNWGGNGATLGRLFRTKIMLPLTENNRPNWQFMEDYTQQLMQSKKQDYIAYCQRELAKLTYKEILPLEQKEWGEFFIEDVANVKAGVRLTKADMTTGNIPFIGSSDSNNGVTAFVSNINKSEDSNILGVNYNGSVVENFYHPYTAIFSDDVKKLSLKDTKGNKFLYLFLKVCILQQKNKYQYAYKFNETRLKRQKILLPMTQDEQPDYAYMEQYMINFEYQKRSHYLSYIQQK